MKNLKSLTASFLFAAAAFFTANPQARAQTLDDDSDYYSQPTTLDNFTDFISQRAIEEISMQGPTSIYPAVGRGFGEGMASTGENIGIEFQLVNGFARPLRAYNLDNAIGAQQFDNAQQRAAVREADLLLQDVYYPTYPNYGLYPAHGIIPVGWREVHYTYPGSYTVPGGYYPVHQHGHGNGHGNGNQYNPPRDNHHHNNPPRHNNGPRGSTTPGRR